MKKRICIFVSGNGTNCENIIRYFHANDKADVAFVLSNRSDAYALVRAKGLGVKTVIMTKEEINDESKLLRLMYTEHIDFIVLAGFLLKVPNFLIDAYNHRMINIHPALLPNFGGKGMYGHRVHEAVKKVGATETGMTVHWVTPEYDSGEIIAQYKVQLSAQDTVDDIAAKEHLLEMKYFPIIIEKCLENISDDQPD